MVTLIYSSRGTAFKPLIYLLSLQHTNQPRARTARSSLSRALLSPENDSGIRRMWCKQGPLLFYLPCGHTHSPAALGHCLRRLDGGRTKQTETPGPWHGV